MNEERFRRALSRSSFGEGSVTIARKNVSVAQRNAVLKRVDQKRASTSKKSKN